ncbi:MAG: DUF4180 domain-containing protein [Clostridia bacterium]|nr:DUF4180 domain-containing protein [Clostridia bacterium]
MEVSIVIKNGKNIAIVKSSNALICDVQSALDFIANINYETGCNRIVIYESVLCEEFFNLKTKIAGDILQKFINYQIRAAIVGDFTQYTSKSLKDFIYECNNGKDIFFLSKEEEAIQALSR